jgi:hypothetical protein
MEKLAEKLYLKDCQRICILNTSRGMINEILAARPSLIIDEKIDPKFLYNFFLIFVTDNKQVEELATSAVHNLYEDGILWFAYPRKINGHESLLSKNSGWDPLERMGLKGVSNIIIDDSWNAIRFRNSKFVRSRYSIRDK